MVFQAPTLFEWRTVRRNVALPLELAGVKRRKRDLRVDELLDLVGLADKANAYPAQLSGGQKQRVGIARALAAGPSVLLCDEATSALDPDTTRSILGLLRDVTSRLGVTVLLITHEYEVVKSVCDSVALLREGKVVEKGPIASLLATPKSVLAHALLPRLPAVDPSTAGAGGLLADLTFLGEAANRPVITETARTFGIDISVVAGALETIAGLRVGRLRVELLGAAEACESALRRFGELELAPEVPRG
jgi:D-methionine transport system ATP-binding protein